MTRVIQEGENKNTDSLRLLRLNSSLRYNERFHRFTLVVTCCSQQFRCFAVGTLLYCCFVCVVVLLFRCFVVGTLLYCCFVCVVVVSSFVLFRCCVVLVLWLLCCGCWFVVVVVVLMRVWRNFDFVF